MFPSISVKKVVKFHLYVIVLFFIILAGLSLRTSDISRDNFDNTIKLHNRSALVNKALYKLMETRGDVLFMKTAMLTNQVPNQQVINSINNNNKEIRSIVSQWIKEPKMATYSQ